MGTLFSAVDKIVSSFGSAFVGILCASIGFTEQLPSSRYTINTRIEIYRFSDVLWIRYIWIHL